MSKIVLGRIEVIRQMRSWVIFSDFINHNYVFVDFKHPYVYAASTNE